MKDGVAIVDVTDPYNFEKVFRGEGTTESAHIMLPWRLPILTYFCIEHIVNEGTFSQTYLCCE